MDNLVKRERKNARGKEENDDDAIDDAAQGDTENLLARVERQLDEAGAFNPEGIADTREHDLSSIVRRRGQPAFRKHLLSAYSGRCAITGCDVAAVLDAAHIVSYRGPETNHPANGLLLRTDLHTLFDLRMVAVDVDTMTLLVSPDSQPPATRSIAEGRLELPRAAELSPVGRRSGNIGRKAAYSPKEEKGPFYFSAGTNRGLR